MEESSSVGGAILSLEVPETVKKAVVRAVVALTNLMLLTYILTVDPDLLVEDFYMQ